MKKISTLLAAAITFLSSCQKADEYLSDDMLKGKYVNDQYLQHKPNAEVKQCSIVQIVYEAFPGTNDVLQFTYNAAGDPLSITRQLGAHTGYPNYIFKYDEKNRLTELIGPYNGNTTAEFWHKYFYDNKGNIILDSTYVFPQMQNGFPENYHSRRLTFYTYDNKRRIVGDSTVFSNPVPSVVHTYGYDANGNRTGRQYDDKINVNRTNKIWMFLNRDYSVNNPFTATSYNATGLPSSFNLSPEENGFQFLGNSYHAVQVVYACDNGPGK
jgi:hypothetical protein